VTALLAERSLLTATLALLLLLLLLLWAAVCDKKCRKVR
jgi:hypothetical protein